MLTGIREPMPMSATTGATLYVPETGLIEDFYQVTRRWFAEYGITHFDPEEIVPVRRGIPPLHMWPRIIALGSVLEYLRVLTEAPIFINSGYRDPEYNEAIGGVPKSQHPQLRAADIVSRVMRPRDVAVAAMASPFGYSGMLGVGEYDTFTHIDVRGWPGLGDGRFPAERSATWTG